MAILPTLCCGSFILLSTWSFFGKKRFLPVMKQLPGSRERAIKEITYHIRHTAEWIIRLGDGTDESHRRMNTAIGELHRYTDELFHTDDITGAMVADGVIGDPNSLKDAWQLEVSRIFAMANLEVPEEYWPQFGGRIGEHGEAMGYLLADLQYMQRTYPGMSW